MAGGSISLAGNASSGLTVTQDDSLALGSGDFTIEWFQYQTDSNSWPRVFSIGSYPTATIALTIEGGTIYFWVGGTSFIDVAYPDGNQYNNWHHFAITRSSGSVRIYLDGTLLITEANSTNFTASTALNIGHEGTGVANAAFGGLITNFRWVAGTAVYTGASLTVPVNPLTDITNTKLLLLASSSGTALDDSSTLNQSVSGTYTWSASTPLEAVACLGGDTRIMLCDRTYCKVSELRIGEMLPTKERGYQPVVGLLSMMSRQVHNQPYLIGERTLISATHRVWMEEHPDQGVAASNHPKAVPQPELLPFRYYHVRLAVADWIQTEDGLWVESFGQFSG